MPDSITRSVFIDASPEKVWAALTDHREFGAWFRAEIDAPFAVGVVTRGSMTYPGVEGLPLAILPEAMDCPRRFAFRWPQWDFETNRNREDDQPWTLVAFVLESEGQGTRVTVTESGFDRLEAGFAARVLHENTQGWEIQLQNLARHVA